MESTSLAQLEGYAEQFTAMAVIGGLHGNVDAEDAENLAELLTTLLPLNRVPRTRPVVQQLDESASIDLQSTTTMRPADLRPRPQRQAIAGRKRLGGPITAFSFLSSLRTDQQLGYVVSAGIRRMTPRAAICFWCSLRQRAAHRKRGDGF